ncbi:MAG: O-methyltransferase [Acidimicrobiia bacterium]|nr:O-methyltransferase [Acidimicrobiia bacterium]
MTPKAFFLTDELHTYLLAHAPPIDEIQRDLIAETAALGDISTMQIAPEQGAFMTLVAQMLGARLVVEVGTFTGYSTLALARGVGDGGRIVACDVSEEWTSVARRAWERAGVADRIDLRIAPAIETLRALPTDEPIDLAFIDADKTGYADYYEEILARMEPGGVILVDNVLWSGLVAQDPAPDDDDDTRALRAFNDMIQADDRVESVILTIADGLSLIRRRGD